MGAVEDVEIHVAFDAADFAVVLVLPNDPRVVEYGSGVDDVANPDVVTALDCSLDEVSVAFRVGVDERVDAERVVEDAVERGDVSLALLNDFGSGFAVRGMDVFDVNGRRKVTVFKG